MLLQQPEQQSFFPLLILVIVQSELNGDSNLGTVKAKETSVKVYQRSISQSCQDFEGNRIYFFFSITAAESAEGLMIKNVYSCHKPLISPNF